MRKTILAMWLAGMAVPAVARAQTDGGIPDGMASTARTVDEEGKGGHTGYSDDPNGNMGDSGRTGKPVEGPGNDQNNNDANEGAEGHTGSAPDASTQ